MNNDLISRSALKEVLERYLYAPHVRLGGSMCEGMRMAIKTCISLMENAKPVDAVEVVRCRECKHYHDDTLTCQNDGCGAEHPNWYADDFCSYGERKGDDA